MIPTGRSAHVLRPTAARCGAPRVWSTRWGSGSAPHRRPARRLWRWRAAQAAYRFVATRGQRAARLPGQPYRGDRPPREPGPHRVGGARSHCSRVDQPPGAPGRGAPGPYGLSGSAGPSSAGVHACACPPGAVGPAGGPVPRRPAPGASRGPSASRNASHGSPVWRPSAAHPRGVPSPGWSALATVTPRSTPCGRPSVRRVSSW